MTIEEIHRALSEGKTIHWVNKLYYLHYVSCESDNESAKLSYIDGKGIRVTCLSNYFGSLITEGCLSKCYIAE